MVYPNRLRFDWRGQRVAAGSNAGEIVESLEWTIYDKSRKIHYSLIYGAHMILGSDPSVRPSDPRAYHVFINTANGDEAKTLMLMHPRQQTWPNWFIGSFGADALSWMRMLNDAEVTAAKEPDGLVRVAIKKTAGLDVYWLSPEQGYGIVRAKHWMPGDSEADEPQTVQEARFRKAGNGAFVVEYRKSRQMRLVDGGFQPKREEEVTLLEIDMQIKLDPKQFTLDGLDLPVGAQVHDNISGTKYGYGVPAVAE